MKVSSPSSRDIDQLLAFVPHLKALGGQYIVDWGGGTKQPNGVFLLPWPNYPDVVEKFFEAAGEDCWWDVGYVPADAGEMVRNEAFIAGASLAQIRTMLTWCVRGERFCDGHWAKVLEDGTVYSLLRRLEHLREQGASR